MGIYIKGMEMPQSCWECRFNSSTIDHREACLLTNKTYNWGLTTPPSDCPLIPVPDHGRLIDADRLEAKWASCDHGVYYDKIIFVQSILKAPTIIPADGKDTNVPTREEARDEP